MQEKHTTLFLREGSSDKVYQADLTREGKGWVVDFAFGRRGSALKPGRKTPQPLAYEAAARVYAQLVKSKTAKGYTESESGSRFEGMAEAGRVSGLLPQLLNAVPDVEPYLVDDAWWAQPKWDGQRVMVRRQGSAVTGCNRRGLTIPLPSSLVARVQAVAEAEFVLDGELVGDVFHAFDVVEPGPYSARLKRVADLLGQEPLTARTTTEKRALLRQAEASGGEGIVLKRHDAPYTPGRPNDGGPQVKWKLTATASCIVVGINDRRSVAVGLLPSDGSPLVEVGNVSVPPNHEVPGLDDVVEVEYLYAFPGGSLYQPVYRGVRADLPLEECTVAQLKLKASTA